ncbi:MAG TPA: 2-C-methyl-D-erythritol 4-phosphate cytidylyltransferase [Candidatus Limnocylindrales bacterium]|jgi:2-C-methyl-D-erythritol 4-phosphate cytidylyltransferase/2-C-methyl-D-erythritol 2,4-cyclodiphosphate synthase
MGDVVADAIVVAAGRSERMGGQDKLTADLGGRPVLAWSLAALAASPLVDRIALVRTAEQAAASRPAWLPDKVVAVVAGGARRQDSVAAGIRALGADAADSHVLLVHDGARPLVSLALIDAVARAAAEHGAAIPVLPVAETLKRVDDGLVAGTIDRSHAVTAQTPQGIRWDVLRSAIQRVPAGDAAELTDEAALLEAAGIAVRTVAGEPANRKVTLPVDLAFAEAQLTGAAVTRTGYARDSHPFGPGDGLRLAGIEIAGAPRLHGHSDGDAALHAIAGALLGAVAMGDLGALYPADERTPRGVASADLLRDVRRHLADAGWKPASIDLSMHAARPWLERYLPLMRAAIAELLGLEVAAVSVKASTGNLSGDAGAGRTIEAEALATVTRSGGAR